jgi:hypothetical protein
LDLAPAPPPEDDEFVAPAPPTDGDDEAPRLPEPTDEEFIAEALSPPFFRLFSFNYLIFVRFYSFFFIWRTLKPLLFRPLPSSSFPSQSSF